MSRSPRFGIGGENYMEAFAFLTVMLCWLLFIVAVTADHLPDRFIDKVFRKMNGGKPFEPYDRDWDWD